MNVIIIFLNQDRYLHMCSLWYNYAITCMEALLPFICTPVLLSISLSLLRIRHHAPSPFSLSLSLSIFLSNCQFLFQPSSGRTDGIKHGDAVYRGIGGSIVIARPMKRPPIGWDARNMRNTVRGRGRGSGSGTPLPFCTVQFIVFYIVK